LGLALDEPHKDDRILDEGAFTFAVPPDVARFLGPDREIVVAFNLWWGDVVVRIDQAGCC